MNCRSMMLFAAISGFILVALGAFSAHFLNRILGTNEMAWIRTGLEYQAFHTLALLALAVEVRRRCNLWFYWSAALLALGTVLFSGSLYCFALSQLKIWVYVTPVGGVSFLLGWALMVVGVLRWKSNKAECHE
ncbi:DUF423 domain-containing protein [Serratia microhaemolytica]|uniref:DUF423 domain-containing protein n=1 Tax=Serratia microhaemolytica TaxID=2675110 RepID=UPI00198008B7|nr:DUF423 domain-containing protein [Serratia microhaemolytica]